MSPSHGAYVFEHEGRHSYHTYTPSPLQVVTSLTIDADLSAQLASAHRLFGKLDGMFRYIPDMDKLAYPLVNHEAEFSCDMDRQEALYNERFGAEPLRTKNDKMIDVYSNALLCAPTFFSNENALLDSIRDIHGQMFGSDYDDAGQFRARQLFSYPKVTTNGMYPNYNPPSPDEILPAMEALSEYISTPNELDPLIIVALVYYQLATIRPFLVGNGVIERICVNYLLVETGKRLKKKWMKLHRIGTALLLPSICLHLLSALR